MGLSESYISELIERRTDSPMEGWETARRVDRKYHLELLGM